MRFQALDKVEVIGTDEGLQGSLHPAKILHRLRDRKYLVQYKWLVCEDDRNVKLEEAVPEYLVRPKPVPVVRRRYKNGDEVDVFHKNCCWWSGTIVKSTYRTYYGVKFDGYKGVWYYPYRKIRLHPA